MHTSQRFIFNPNVKTQFFLNIDSTVHPLQKIFTNLLTFHLLHSPEFGLRPLKWFKNVFPFTFLLIFYFLNGDSDLLDIFSASWFWIMTFLPLPVPHSIGILSFKKAQHANIQIYKRKIKKKYTWSLVVQGYLTLFIKCVSEG